jgi:hypothetical protein
MRLGVDAIQAAFALSTLIGLPQSGFAQKEFPPVATGQTSAVKHRNGNALVTIGDISLFKFSTILKETIPYFHAVVQNISGEPLTGRSGVELVVTIHKRDGSLLTFSVGQIHSDWELDRSAQKAFRPCPCDLETHSSLEVVYPFPQPWFTEADVDMQSVEFAFPDHWKSPEDMRIAAEGEAKRAAAEAAHQQQLAQEQKRKEAALNARQKRMEAALNARLVKERAEQEARAAEERTKLRAACGGIYQNTVDKKVRDLTVREEQQVRACQTLGLYPP